MRLVLCLLMLVAIADVASAQGLLRRRREARAERGLESYRYNEAQRRDNIARQLDANDQMRYRRGTAYDVYVTSRRGLFGRRRERVYVQPRPVYASPIALPTETWTYVEPRSVPQPIGRREVQTGPHRWESEPVYEEPDVVRSVRRRPVAEDRYEDERPTRDRARDERFREPPRYEARERDDPPRDDRELDDLFEGPPAGAGRLIGDPEIEELPPPGERDDEFDEPRSGPRDF